MKAQSLILQHVQLPITMLGMPPAVAFCLVGLGLGLLVAGMLSGWMTVGFVSSVIIPGGLAAWVRIISRRDPHHLVSGPLRRGFWKGRSRRVFLAGIGDVTTPAQEEAR